MEAIAAVEILTEVAEKGMPIRKVVGDDDTSFKANIRHSWKAKLDDPLDSFGPEDWPRTKSGAKKKDTGKLPQHVAEVLECLADPSHRTRTFGSPYYEQSRKTRANNPYGFNTNDAERLKTNHGYFLSMYCRCPFDEFKRRSNAIVEHHFNNHEFCGLWCWYSSELPVDQRKTKPTAMEKKYRCKELQPELYELTKSLAAKLLTDERLRESHHPYNSQTNEALNNMIAKFAPKNRDYSQTISLRARVAMAICIHSVGLEAFLERLSDRMGFASNTSSLLFFVKRDKQRQYKSEY
jgi:hypothetical protein